MFTNKITQQPWFKPLIYIGLILSSLFLYYVANSYFSLEYHEVRFTQWYPIDQYLPYVALPNISITANESIIKYQITKGIQYMCKNQNSSNGQFLYEVRIKANTLQTTNDNNMVRQSGGLYALGQYYHYIGFNHNANFSITQCLQQSIKYLQHHSIAIIDDKHNGMKGELVDGNTGATALAVLGMLEMCLGDERSDSICCIFAEQFTLWIKGLIIMGNAINRDRNRLYFDSESYLELNDIIKSLNKHYHYKWDYGAFGKKYKRKRIVGYSPYYDAESYLAIARFIANKEKLEILSCFDGKRLIHMLQNMVNGQFDGLDSYFNKYRFEDNAHWVIQSWYERWNINHKDIFVMMMMEKMNDWLHTHNSVNYNYCYQMEAAVDLLYVLDNRQIYGEFRNKLYRKVVKHYDIISKTQIMNHNMNDSQYDIYGAFRSSIGGKRLRVDDTQHCVSALMKYYKFLFKKQQYLAM